MATLGQTITGAVGGGRGGGNSETAMILQALAALGKTSTNIGSFFQQMEMMNSRARDESRADLRLGMQEALHKVQLESGQLGVEAQKRKKKKDIKTDKEDQLVKDIVSGKVSKDGQPLDILSRVAELEDKQPVDSISALAMELNTARDLTEKAIKNPNVAEVASRAQVRVSSMIPTTITKLYDKELRKLTKGGKEATLELKQEAFKIVSSKIENLANNAVFSKNFDIHATRGLYEAARSLRHLETPEIEELDDDRMMEYLSKEGLDPARLPYAVIAHASAKNPKGGEAIKNVMAEYLSPDSSLTRERVGTMMQGSDEPGMLANLMMQGKDIGDLKALLSGYGLEAGPRIDPQYSSEGLAGQMGGGPTGDPRYLIPGLTTRDELGVEIPLTGTREQMLNKYRNLNPEEIGVQRQLMRDQLMDYLETVRPR